MSELAADGDRVDSVESHSNDPRSRVILKKRWSDEEERVVRQHREDGYVMISELMRGRGMDRSPEAVKRHALKYMGLRLPKYPREGLRRCVACGRFAARPSTQSGRAGFCPSCWDRRKAEAYAEGTEEMRAKLAYDRERKRRKDMKRKLRR